ncbi:MAG: hypothetical protein JSW73_04150 [Candidatus Woesearchaeota archaeon]|nr:MAG: hypothetical protein JSW73_04150 [Candidatus Woesearchaeota archaeon]
MVDIKPYIILSNKIHLDPRVFKSKVIDGVRKLTEIVIIHNLNKQGILIEVITPLVTSNSASFNSQHRELNYSDFKFDTEKYKFPQGVDSFFNIYMHGKEGLGKEGLLAYELNVILDKKIDNETIDSLLESKEQTIPKLETNLEYRLIESMLSYVTGKSKDSAKIVYSIEGMKGKGTAVYYDNKFIYKYPKISINRRFVDIVTKYLKAI